LDEDAVFARDRPTLLDAVAKIIVKGPEKPAESASEMPVSIWERELSLREQELILRKEERLAEQRRWDELDRQRKLESDEEAEIRRQAEAERENQRKAE
jgi:hypothetical protein